jgi:hypothetical protein
LRQAVTAALVSVAHTSFIVSPHKARRLMLMYTHSSLSLEIKDGERTHISDAIDMYCELTEEIDDGGR